MNSELWVDIVNYEGLYQVSNLGRVRSLDRVIKRSNGSNLTLKGRVRKLSDDTRGYLAVRLSNKDGGSNKKVHKLVLSMFSTKLCEDYQINHINGVKYDNRLKNLEWCTASENSQHAHDAFLKTPTSKKLTNYEVVAIKKLLRLKTSIREIADLFKMSISTIYDIKNKKSWKHIGDE